MGFHKQHKHEEPEENWLISYADMITLLLCFFLIMLSTMQPKQSDLEKVAKMFEAVTDVNIETPFTDLKEQMESFIAEQALESEMSVEESEKGIVLELASSSFYESGSAVFKKEMIPVLEELAKILDDFAFEDYKVDVEGHTDDAPIQTVQFPSNWELSALRATGIVRFFIDHGQEKEKLQATAYADVMPKVPNLDEFGNPIEENRELNRRVVIRIERRQ